MPSQKKDSGLIIKKRKLLNGQVMVTVFSQVSGKIVLSAFGIKKLTSRRLSHLEVGNYITFSYGQKNDFLTMRETDLQYGHSQIKTNENRLNMLYLVFFVLNKLLPENEPEENVHNLTLTFLRKLNKEMLPVKELEMYFVQVLFALGFLDEEKANEKGFDVVSYIESIIGQKVEIAFD